MSFSGKIGYAESDGRQRVQASCGVLLLQVIPARAAEASRREVMEALGRRAAALERALPCGWRIIHAVHDMQGSGREVEAAVAEAAEAGVRRLVVVPLHAQFSAALGGKALGALYEALRGPYAGLHVEVRASFADDCNYIEAIAQDLQRRALADSAMPASHELRFVPMAEAEVAAGDSTFRADLARTAELVRARLGWAEDRCSIEFNGDGTGACCEALVCQLGTLPALPEHGDDGFTKVLVSLVRRGVHAAEMDRLGAPLLKQSWKAIVERNVDDLVMIGVSMRGALSPERSPGFRYCTQAEHRLVKRPHMEVVELLRTLRGGGRLEECFIWSTCNRFELYGWVSRDRGDREAQLREVGRVLLGDHEEVAGSLNILEGPQAWKHLVSTAAGLNSVLAGDGEVVDQLEAAIRTGHHAGSAGPRSDALGAAAFEAVGELRQATAWGGYASRYCWIALEQLRGAVPELGPGCRVLVLGGSTTSCSVLEALGERFGIRREHRALVYRGYRNGRMAKRMMSAAGETASVETYEDPAVLDQLARADVIILATDQREPVLTGGMLRGARQGRPATIIDFNTMGSTIGIGDAGAMRLITAAELDDLVKRFNGEIIDDAVFLRAAAQAQRWIEGRVHPDESAIAQEQGHIWNENSCRAEGVLA